MRKPNQPSTSRTSTARRCVVAASLLFAIGLAGVVTAKVQNEKLAEKSILTLSSAVPMALAVSQAPVELASSPLPLDEAALDDAIPAAATITTDLPSGAIDLPQEPAARFRTIRMEVTAYCACKKCCGPNAQGITASGKRVSYNGGKFVAADTRLLPFGTRLQVPGYHDGETVEVIDRGGAIKGNKLDLYFDSHRTALEWGRQWVDVVVLD